MKHRRVFNLVAFGLMAVFLVPSLLNTWKSQSESYPLPEVARFDPGEESAVNVRPLDEFRVIVERNLFGASGEIGSGSDQDTTPLEGIPAAQDSLGLELVGTVVADNPRMKLAVIDNRSSRKQEIYHEGEKAGEVLIKRILRNNVIIGTERGDEALAIDPERNAPRTSPPERPPPARQAKVRRQPPSISRISTSRVQRDEVESYLESLDEPERPLHTVPYQEHGEPAGVRIRRVTPGSVLAKMGFRTGDVIKGVNDEAITSPEQANEFFGSLVEDGKITIEIKRGRNTQELRLEIE